MRVHEEPLRGPVRASPLRAAAEVRGGAASPAVQRLAATGRGLNARPEVVAQRAWGERLSAAASARASARPVAQRSRVALAASPVVQREPITPEAAETALGVRAAAFAATEHQILQPWDTDWDSNCHGYTVTQDPTAFLDGDSLLANIGDTSAMVFVQGGTIAHSGLVAEGGQLQHLLIGVGVLRSVIEGTMGYAGVYTLPQQREALDAYLLPHVQELQRGAAIDRMVHVAHRAREFEGGEALEERIYALQDGNADFGEVSAEFDAFVELHPEILQDAEEQ